MYHGVEYKICIHFEIKQEASHECLGLYMAEGYALRFPGECMSPVPLVCEATLTKKIWEDQ